MAIVARDGAKLDVEQTGSGRDLVLLHSLLTDRSAFDRVRPGAGHDASAHAGQPAGLRGFVSRRRRRRKLRRSLAGAVRRAAPAAADRRPRATVSAASSRCRSPRARHRVRPPDRRRRAGVVPRAGEAAAAESRRESRAGRHGGSARRRDPAHVPAGLHRGASRGSSTSASEALAKADPACFRAACLALARLDFTPVLGTIRNPTLVMAGALDQTTPTALVRELLDAHPRRGVPRDPRLRPLPADRGSAGVRQGRERLPAARGVGNPSPPCARGGRSRFQAYCAWMRPRSGMQRRVDRVLTCRLHGRIPGNRGPCSTFRRTSP